jgi:hypothetical protein
MNEHERVVRETWAHIQDTKTLLAIWSYDEEEIVAQFWAGDWAAAYAFTQKRLQAIAEVREEIEEVLIWELAYEDESCGSAPCERILSRLQAALADLEKGLRK